MASVNESLYDPELHPQGLNLKVMSHKAVQLQTSLLSSPSFPLLLLCGQRIEEEFNSGNLALNN